MYIKYADYSGQTLSEGDSVLMSLEEYRNGGKNLIGVPVTVTPDGKEPPEMEENNNAVSYYDSDNNRSCGI